MEVFTFNLLGAETLTAFNERLAEFCVTDDNPVVGIVSSLAGDTLVISLSQLEDLPVMMPMAVLPVVGRVMPTQALTLETSLTEALDEIHRAHKDDEPRLPIEVRMHTDANGNGFYVVVVNIGSIEQEEE